MENLLGKIVPINLSFLSVRCDALISTSSHSYAPYLFILNTPVILVEEPLVEEVGDFGLGGSIGNCK